MPTTIEPFKLSPSAQAHMELLALGQDASFHAHFSIGGVTLPEEHEANRKKAVARRKRELEIIAKYGVAEEYLTPLQLEEGCLRKRLAEVQREMAELLGIIKKRSS